MTTDRIAVSSGSAVADERKNWAGNYRYHARTLRLPSSVEQLQEIVARSERLKALGTRHCFNGIGDTTADHVSLELLNHIVDLDRRNHTVAIEAGVRYGELCQFLQREGFALQNLASLPHISVAGACATATHGSGDRNGNLATAVAALEMVTADGAITKLSRNDPDFFGAVVGLGALGVITRLTLNIESSYAVRQTVYENLPLAEVEEQFDDIAASGDSVSLFTDWSEQRFHQVWVKQRVDRDDASTPPPKKFFGASRAPRDCHPIPGHPAENCTRQMAVAGPWNERLPHFRLEFTPSSGDELQSEYFVPRRHATAALRALADMGASITPLLFVSEVRTIAVDELWMSPCYGQACVAFHFTWKPNASAVEKVLPLLEAALLPFDARPHWGKLFTMAPERLQALYEKLPDFRRLMLRNDPTGKFQNAFLEAFVGDPRKG